MNPDGMFDLTFRRGLLSQMLAFLDQHLGRQVCTESPSLQRWTREPTFRELHLEFDLNSDLYLHGYVDRLDVAPTGEVRIVDYKTGKSPKPGWEAKALFQLQVYALLYYKTHNVLPRLLLLIYLGDGALVRSTPTLADLAATEATLIRIANEIKLAIEKDIWPTKPSRLCDWCYFKAICPAHT